VTSKLGTQTLPRINMAGAYLLAMWCPVYRWRDFNLGLGAELGNSSCNAKGKPYKCENTKGESTDVREGGGSSGSSNEALVTSVERSG